MDDRTAFRRAHGATSAPHERYRVSTPLSYLERAARIRPESVAVVDETGSCTYRELEAMSERMGSALLEARAALTEAGGTAAASTSAAAPAAPALCAVPTRPQPVVIFMEKSTHMLAAFLGTLMAGGFYVPVDPGTPVERAASIFDTLSSDGATPLVVANKETNEAARACFPNVRIFTVEELLAHPRNFEALAAQAQALVDTAPAYVLFTSGSTGTPKGVAVSHRAICGFIDGFVETFDIRAHDVMGNQAPFDFDISVKDIYGSLAAGATLAILPRRLFSAPAELVEALRERQVTVLVWAVAALCLVSSLHALDGGELPNIRLVLFSGEVMPQPHLVRWMQKLPDATFANLYGPTEVTCNCLYHVVDRNRAYPGSLPLGNAFPNRRVLVLDEAGHPVTEPGQEGELYVGGPDIALGYYGDRKRTEAAFVQNPLVHALPETLYKTGDRVSVGEGGELFFCGRIDNQIKHLGHRIELEEIDAAFEREPGVERCRCAYDEDRHRIYAFYEGAAEGRELRAAVAKRLPIPLVPARAIRVDAMPLTKNGKVDRRALLALVTLRRTPAAPLPASVTPSPASVTQTRRS